MVRAPCCDEAEVKKGPWTTEEDEKLKEHIEKHGSRNWRNLPKKAGLKRCGKSCRLRWTNYLRPDIKRGKFSDEEERLIIHLHSVLGNKWSMIATSLPGRTDNEIKNYWNTHIRKKLLTMGIDPVTHRRRTDLDVMSNLPNLLAAAAGTLNLGNTTNPLESALRLQADVTHLARIQLIKNLLQIPLSTVDALSSIVGYNALQTGLISDLYQPNFSNSGIFNSNILNQESDVSNEDQVCCSASQRKMRCGTDESLFNTFQAPSLVETSPEDIAQKSASENTYSSLSSLSESSEKLNLSDLVHDDFGWKDILDQLSWSSKA